MPLAVDAAGRITANPRTGRINGKSDTNKLRDDIVKSSSNYENALANILQKNTRSRSDTGLDTNERPSGQYTGISGGTPVSLSSRRKLGGQYWSPTMSSPTSSTNEVQSLPKTLRSNNNVPSASDVLYNSNAQSAAGALRASGLFPDPDSWTADTQDEQDEINGRYEKMFSGEGMSDEDIKDIHSRGSAKDIFMGNPATQAVTDDIGSNPWLDVDVNELQVPGSKSDDDTPISIAGDTLGWLYDSMFDENGNYRGPNIPSDYQSTTKTTIGDTTAIDDGTSLDYDHLTADRVTGEQMQKYVEQGMGGRTWWDYSPYMVYLKSDEAQHHGYRPYLPDETSKVNMGITSALDTPGDLAGALSEVRTSALPSYSILYDLDDDPEKYDLLRLNGNDYDRKKTPYYHNMNKLVAEDPNIYLRRPEDDKIHGAPVSITVLENAVEDVNGDTIYTYGNISDVEPGDDYSIAVPLKDGTYASVPYQDFKLDKKGNPIEFPEWFNTDDVDFDDEDKEWKANNDFTYYKIHYSDGSSIDIPVDEYDSWFDENNKATDEYPGKYVSVDKVSGTLPEDLDSLNEYYRENIFNPEEDTWTDYPVYYVPDMVMSDGTRLTYPQFMDIYTDDKRADKDPYDFAGTNVAYDYNMANKPSVLMKNGGQLFNEDLSRNWDDLLPGAFDMTMGSLPISFDQIAWPLSVSTALSKSLAGLEANGYDALTDSDMYISGEIDEDTGKFTPSVRDIDKLAGAVGNALVPATEGIAGNVSGRSLIPALSGDIPMNPTIGQLLKAWFLGNFGEGIEEIPGNVVDELTMYADRAYGMPIDPESGMPLMRRGAPILGRIPGPLVPVTDENGDYVFVDKDTGEPITEMYDSANHVYKDPNTSFVDRLANFYTDTDDIANALAGGYSVGGMMSLPNLALVPQAVRNTAYRKKMNLPQYVEPEEVEVKTVDPEKIRDYLGDRK